MKKAKLLSNRKDLARTIKRPIGAKVIMVLLITYCILLLYPYTIALNGGFRTWSSFVDNIFALKDYTLENFRRVFTEFYYPVVMKDGTPGAYYFNGLVFNSLAFSLGCAFAGTTCPLIVGYCTARFPNAFSKFLLAALYVLMALPIVGTTAAAISMTKKLGLYNSIPGMWFLKFNFMSMLTVIYNARFRTVAKEYYEAAYIDGAGELTIFLKVVFPMVREIWFIGFLRQFIAFWSDYSTVLFYMPDKPTLSLALLNFNKLPGTIETMQLAAALVVSIPTLGLFIFFKNKLAGGNQIGGIKG